MRYLAILISTLGMLMLSSCKQETASTVQISVKPTTIYCGTYTKKEDHVNGSAKGIHILKQNSNGQLTFVKTVEGTINPSFVAISQDGKYLYSVSEVGSDIDSTSFVDSYKIEGDDLKFINRKSTFGYYACHVAVNDHLLVVSNYMGGITTYRIGSNGAISELLGVTSYEYHGEHARQERSHPHSFTFSPDGKNGYVCDLGGDRIYQYGISSDSLSITSLEKEYSQISPNSGPRQLVFHPDGKRAFVVNELENKLVVCDYNSSSGFLSRRSELPTLPIGYPKENWSADVHVHPSGKYVYASNRGHGSIAIYRIGEGSRLNFVDFTLLKGKTPRSFMISKDGKYIHVGLQDANAIESFEIADDGRLISIGLIEIPTPVCLIEA